MNCRRSRFKTYGLLHVDLLKFEPQDFCTDEGHPPRTIIVHKEAEDRKPEKLSWDEFIYKHLHMKDVDQDHIRRQKGWFIVFCCFVINILVLGFFKSLGILLIEFRNDFNATPADVSIVVCVTYSLNSIAGPLACFMVVKYSPRCVALTGTLMVAAGLILSWFATSIFHLCFTIGVLGGFGSGLTYSPGLILVGSYFTKNRGLANGIVVSGSPVGGMIMPNVLNFFISTLGCRGALLIIGGFMLNSCICAWAFRNPRPLKKFVRTIYNTDTDSLDELIVGDETPPVTQELEEKDSSNIRRLSGHETENVKTVSSIHAVTTSSQSITDHKIQDVFGREKMKTVREAGRSQVKVPNIVYSPTAYGERPLAQCYQQVSRKPSEYLPNDDLSKLRRRTSKTHNNMGSSGLRNYNPYKKNLRMARRRQARNSTAPYILSLDHSCVVLMSREGLNLYNKKPMTVKGQKGKAKKLVRDSNGNVRYTKDGATDDSDEDIGDENESPKGKKNRCIKDCCKNNKYFSLSAIKMVLKNPLYVVLLLSNATPAIGTTNVFLLIPSFAKYLGMSRDEYSTIYLMVSLFDMIGRLFGTLLSDKKIFRPRTIYASGLLLAGTFSILMGNCIEYTSLISVSAMFGFATGLHVGILGVLLQEIVGTEMLPAGYAFSMILNGLLVLIGPYICGYLLSEYTGCYWPMYTVFGIILICGASLWLLPLCRPKLRRARVPDNTSSSEILSFDSSDFNG